MRESIPTIESKENFFSISRKSQGRLPEIKRQLKAGRQVAFTVTSDFKIHVGSSGLHSAISGSGEVDPEDQDTIVYKGHVSGAAKKIFFEKYNDGSHSPTSEQQNQAAIKDSINELIDFPEYFQ